MDGARFQSNSLRSWSATSAPRDDVIEDPTVVELNEKMERVKLQCQTILDGVSDSTNCNLASPMLGKRQDSRPEDATPTQEDARVEIKTPFNVAKSCTATNPGPFVKHIESANVPKLSALMRKYQQELHQLRIESQFTKEELEEEVLSLTQTQEEQEHAQELQRYEKILLELLDISEQTTPLPQCEPEEQQLPQQCPTPQQSLTPQQSIQNQQQRPSPKQSPTQYQLQEEQLQQYEPQPQPDLQDIIPQQQQDPQHFNEPSEINELAMPSVSVVVDTAGVETSTSAYSTLHSSPLIDSTPSTSQIPSTAETVFTLERTTNNVDQHAPVISEVLPEIREQEQKVDDASSKIDKVSDPVVTNAPFPVTTAVTCAQDIRHLPDSAVASELLSAIASMNPTAEESSLQELYIRYVQVMYTNEANLQHTISVQQKLFEQQLTEKQQELRREKLANAQHSEKRARKRDTKKHEPTGPGSFYDRGLDEIPGEKDLHGRANKLRGGVDVPVEVPTEWVVKRRPDGSRYVMRRPVKQDNAKQTQGSSHQLNRRTRARDVLPGASGETTAEAWTETGQENVIRSPETDTVVQRGYETSDEETLKEHKTGRHCVRQERRKHVDKVREYRRRCIAAARLQAEGSSLTRAKREERDRGSGQWINDPIYDAIDLPAPRPLRVEKVSQRFDKGSQRLDKGHQLFDKGSQRLDRGHQRFDRGSQRFDKGFDKGSEWFDKGSQRFDKGFNKGSQWWFEKGFDKGSQWLDKGSQQFGKGFDKGSQQFGRGFERGSQQFSKGFERGSQQFGKGFDRGSQRFNRGSQQFDRGSQRIVPLCDGNEPTAGGRTSRDAKSHRVLVQDTLELSMARACRELRGQRVVPVYDVVELSRRKATRHGIGNVLDHFTTLQELMAHGSRGEDNAGHHPLLSVTTV